MSWLSGAELAEKIERALAPHLDKIGTKDVAALGRTIAEAFEDMDCDTLEGCGGFIGDAANRLQAERYDAPENPEIGATYSDRWGETYRFDGKRWRVVQE